MTFAQALFLIVITVLASAVVGVALAFTRRAAAVAGGAVVGALLIWFGLGDWLLGLFEPDLEWKSTGELFFADPSPAEACAGFFCLFVPEWWHEHVLRPGLVVFLGLAWAAATWLVGHGLHRRL